MTSWLAAGASALVTWPAMTAGRVPSRPCASSCSSAAGPPSTSVVDAAGSHGGRAAGPVRRIGRLEDLSGRVSGRDRLYLQGRSLAGRAGRDRRAERRHPGEPRFAQRIVDQPRRRVAELAGIQVVADQDVTDPGPGQVRGQPGGGRPRLDRLLRPGHQVALAAPGVGHQVALYPRRAGQRFHRLVDRLAPGVDAVRVGRTTSVVSAGWWAPSQLAACRQYDGTWVNEPGCSACPLRYGSARPASPARAATAPATRITRHRQTARASTCAMPSASTTASTGSILNTLRSADSGAVQQVLDLLVQWAPERPAVAGQRPQGGHRDGPAQPERLRQVAAGQPGQAGRGGDGGGRHRPRRAHDDRSRVQPRQPEVQVGDPVAAAAQRGGGRHGRGGVHRLLDIGQEVEAVPALVEQRHQPPRRGQQHGRRPPGGQPPPPRPAASGCTSRAAPARPGWTWRSRRPCTPRSAPSRRRPAGPSDRGSAAARPTGPARPAARPRMSSRPGW